MQIYVKNLTNHFSWKDAFAFGSFISATDTVSCLAIFKEMDAEYKYMQLFLVIHSLTIKLL
jgi:NhaP-type Na+/H+ or K+/H+ antiporter